MSKDPKMILDVVFFRSDAGAEPVREWLKAESADTRKRIGEDIKTVQFGWPLGMPLVRKLAPELWEVRSNTKDGIVRILFTVVGETMVLLHGFVKKTQKTPARELDTAIKRNRKLRREQKP
jgi:phage-related protein